MASKLKVYRAEIGGAHEWIVAAKSQKDAAAIWGVDLDVFHQGRGGPTTKPPLVDAAMADPGTPLRRVLGSKGAFKPIPVSDVETWKLAAKAMGLTGKPKPAPKKAKVVTAKAAPEQRPVVKPNGPSKATVAALAKAETALAAHVAAAERAEARQAGALRALKAKQANERRAAATKRASLEAAVSKARAKSAG